MAQRTFSSATLKLMRRTHVFRTVDDFELEWSPDSSKQWNRILACCQFMKMLPSATFQAFVLESVSTMVVQADICNESVWTNCFSAVSTTFNIAPADWYDDQILAIFNRLINCSFDSVDDLECFAEFARWIDFNEEILPVAEVNCAAQQIRERVVELAEQQLDQNDPSYLGNSLWALEQIKKSLKIDLSAAIYSFEEEIGKWKEPEGHEPERMGSADGGDREIDGLFRALVE